MSTKQKTLWGVAAVFGILAVVFYFSSINKLDRDSARLLGIDSVANVQMTVFCAASAVLCGVNVAAALILGFLEEKGTQNANIGSVASEVVKAIKQDRIEEQQKQKEEEKASILEQERQKKIEEIKQRRVNCEMVDEETFIAEIEDLTSMMDIWEVWQAHSSLQEKYPEANTIITNYKYVERSYGKVTNLSKIKMQISEALFGKDEANV